MGNSHPGIDLQSNSAHMYVIIHMHACIHTYSRHTDQDMFLNVIIITGPVGNIGLVVSFSFLFINFCGVSSDGSEYIEYTCMYHAQNAADHLQQI